MHVLLLKILTLEFLQIHSQIICLSKGAYPRPPSISMLHMLIVVNAITHTYCSCTANLLFDCVTWLTTCSKLCPYKN